MATVETALNSQDRFSGRVPTLTLPMMEPPGPPRLAHQVPTSGPPRPGSGTGRSGGSGGGRRGERKEEEEALAAAAGLVDGERPTSALRRGVKITEFKDTRVNPEPVALEETDLLLEEHLSARKLRDLTGVDNLEEVTFLELKVNTQETSLGNFGVYLPNLAQLKLSNSVIITVRDLGSSLDTLSVLWMSRCGLEDIDGIAGMTNLRELYLSYNEIYDISPCSMLENLAILDLEGNNIDEISQIEFLALCPSLTHLTLEGNPVCLTPSPDEVAPNYDIRRVIKTSVPQLRYLDDEPLEEDEDTSGRRTAASAFDDDWRLIEELMEDGTLAGAAEESIDNIGRPGTAIRPATGYRPGSALKQQVGSSARPGSSLHRRPGSSARPGSGVRPGSGSRGSTGGGHPGAARPGSARPSSARPGSARPSSQGADDQDVMEDASDLTLGGIVCGNPSKALKSRQRHMLNDGNSDKLEKLFSQHAKNPHARPVEQQEPSKETTEQDNANMKELMSELQEWKKVHQERQKVLDAERAPQVLRIEHDDAVDLSGSDDESIDSDLEEEDGSTGPAPHRSSASYDGRRPRVGADFSHSRHQRRPPSPQLSHPEISPGSTPAGGRPTDTPKSRRRRLLQYDDSFEARDDSPDRRLGSSGGGGGAGQPDSRSASRAAAAAARDDHGRSSLRTSHQGSLLGGRADDPMRPGSRSGVRLGPVTDRYQPKSIDRFSSAPRPPYMASQDQPNWRTAVDSSTPGMPRSGSGGSSRSGSGGLDSRGSSAGSPTSSAGPSSGPRALLRGQLSGVPLLPSKMPSKFK